MTTACQRMGKDAVKADCHFSLVALMRRRKILPPEEAFHILRDAPEMLESSAEDFAAAEPLMNRIVVHFQNLERDNQIKELIAAPPTSWPRFHLHLTPGSGKNRGRGAPRSCGFQISSLRAAHFRDDRRRPAGRDWQAGVLAVVGSE